MRVTLLANVPEGAPAAALAGHERTCVGAGWLRRDRNRDTQLREQIRVEIATLSRDSGATVIYITHDQQEALAPADQLAVIREGRICQMASPDAVYWHPADPFVAQFTGLSGHLTGTVVGLAGDRLCRVRIGSTDAVATTVGSLRPRTQVSLLLRPNSLSICSSERTDGILYGMVRDSAFRAGAHDHVVETAGGTRLVGVRSASRASRGANVGIAVGPAGCLAFPLGFDSYQDPPASGPVGASQRPLAHRLPAGPALAQALDLS